MAKKKKAAKKAIKKAAPKKAAPKKVVKKAAVKKAAPKKAAPVPVTRAAFAAADEGTTATVHAKFDNANAGVSDFTATHNNQNPKKLTETGDVSFDGVKHGDTIEDFLDGAPTVTREQAEQFLELASERLIECVSS